MQLIVHVLKFSRGAAIYLPAGPSGHIIFSNYDVVFSNCMEGGVYSFVIFLLGCYFVTFKVLCMRSQRLRAPSEPRQERDRSPKRNRAPTPIQTSSVQDHSKRQSLSCPPESLTIKIQFLYLVGCYFVTFKVLCMRSQRLRAPSEPRQERDDDDDDVLGLLTPKSYGPSTPQTGSPNTSCDVSGEPAIASYG